MLDCKNGLSHLPSYTVTLYICKWRKKINHQSLNCNASQYPHDFDGYNEYNFIWFTSSEYQ